MELQERSQVELLVLGLDHEASHLCGNPNCVYALHLVVEPKSVNTSRSKCHLSFFITTINGVDYVSNHICPHSPKCLPRRLVMAQVLETPRPAPAFSGVATLGLDQKDNEVVAEFDDGGIEDEDLFGMF